MNLPRPIRGMLRAYREDLTPAGRLVLMACGVAAVTGVNTHTTVIYYLFSALFAVIVVSRIGGFLGQPRGVRVARDAPRRATAEIPFRCRYEVRSEAARTRWDVWVEEADVPRGLRVEASDVAVRSLGAVEPGETRWETMSFLAARRGAYTLPGLRITTTLPFGISRMGRRIDQPSQVLVYPRFGPLVGFHVPVGRRHQPGGIPLASGTGDSTEFVGAREYQPGDPLRKIDWRAWARLGRPAVKEYQEEYFCRIALILDTFRGDARREDDFEGAVAFAASVADYFSREEYIVDLFAAGKHFYRMSAGRSLGFIENILDLLSCLEPAPELPFDVLGASLQDHLTKISSTVVVLLDLDPPRIEFLRTLAALGTGLKVVVVHSGSTTEDPAALAGEFGRIVVLDARAAHAPPEDL